MIFLFGLLAVKILTICLLLEKILDNCVYINRSNQDINIYLDATSKKDQTNLLKATGIYQNEEIKEDPSESENSAKLTGRANIRKDLKVPSFTSDDDIEVIINQFLILSI